MAHPFRGRAITASQLESKSVFYFIKSWQFFQPSHRRLFGEALGPTGSR
jgi:hypothetical protein